MCIRCLIRGNAGRWLAKGTGLRAKWHQPEGGGVWGLLAGDVGLAERGLPGVGDALSGVGGKACDCNDC